MVAVGMGADVKFQAFDTHGPQVLDHILTLSAIFYDARPPGVAFIAPVRVAIVLPGIHHAERAVAFEEDRIVVGIQVDEVYPGVGGLCRGYVPCGQEGEQKAGTQDRIYKVVKDLRTSVHLRSPCG